MPVPIEDAIKPLLALAKARDGAGSAWRLQQSVARLTVGLFDVYFLNMIFCFRDHRKWFAKSWRLQ
jgi:hypothetical protein